MISMSAIIRPKFLAFVLTNVMLLSPAKLDSVSPYAIRKQLTYFSLFISLVDMLIAIDPGTELVEGNNVTFWCNAQAYSVANLTSYSWRNSQGDIVSDGARINVTLHNASYSDYYGDFIFNSSLTIFPLLPSDGDQYTCELTLALPRVGVNISNTTVEDIRVAGRTKSKWPRCIMKCNFISLSI